MENKHLFIIFILIAIIAVVAIAFATGAIGSSGSNEKGSITVYAGAGFSEVVDELVKKFNEKYPNIEVNVKYGGSGELFSTLETQKEGDVFLPAAYKYMQEAEDNGYVVNSSVKNITKNVPVIIVQKGNPKNITSLEDLQNDSVKVGLGDANGPAIGKTSQQILEKNNLTVNPTVLTTTVNQLLTYVSSGQVDAAIVWEALTCWKENEGQFDVIEIPEDQNKISTIPIAKTSFSENPEAAQLFIDFVTSDDAKGIWEKWGYKF